MTVSAVVVVVVDAVTVTVTAAVTPARRARVVPPVTSSLSSVAALDVDVAELLLLLRTKKLRDAHGVWTRIQDRLHDWLLLSHASLKGLGHDCSRRNERMKTINV
jgi:hypothetical protein